MTYEEGLEYVKEMSRPYGLEWECVEWYKKFIEAGDDPWTAADDALYEWDI